MARDILWFFRSITSITVRNFALNISVHHDLPSPRIEILCENDGTLRSLWKSPIAKDCCNFTWILSEADTFAVNDCANKTELVIRCADARNIESSSGKSYYDVTVNLKSLCDVKSHGKLQSLNSLQLLPINSIFFGCENIVYVTETFLNTMVGANLMPATGRGTKAEIENNIDETSNSTPDKAFDKEKLRELESDLETACHAASTETLAGTEAYIRKRRIEELTRDVREAEDLLAEEEDALETELLAVREISNLTHELQTHQELSESVIEINEFIRKKWELLQKAEFLLEARQLKMLYELQNIYPIVLNDTTDVYSIRGLELPADLNQQRDDDVVSAALGYVVHLVYLTSKYLDIPLRYQLFYYSSRSMIRDSVSGLNQALPLFRKNTEKERFDRALEWLRKDIEQVLQTRGILYEPTKDILQNLNKLFVCELCPSLTF